MKPLVVRRAPYQVIPMVGRARFGPHRVQLTKGFIHFVVARLDVNRVPRGWIRKGGASRRQGVLLSSGFLVGESLIGILIALTDISLAVSGALALYTGEGSAIRNGLSLALFVGLTFAFHQLVSRQER